MHKEKFTFFTHTKQIKFLRRKVQVLDEETKFRVHSHLLNQGAPFEEQG